MQPGFLVFLVCALLLSFERLVYVAVWRRPEAFSFLCARFARNADPVRVLRALFVVFKALQAGVFFAWCLWWGNGVLRLPADPGGREAVALAMMLAGQFLNGAVFHRLGVEGVFYGVRFGRDVAWCNSFPFNAVNHPQYVGTLLTIWGFFLLLRHPEPDWSVLPALETVYYALGARFEAFRSPVACGDHLDAWKEDPGSITTRPVALNERKPTFEVDVSASTPSSGAIAASVGHALSPRVMRNDAGHIRLELETRA